MHVGGKRIPPHATLDFSLFGMELHAHNVWRVLGGLLMVAGIALVAMF